MREIKEELTAKDFAHDKAIEIIQLCEDLQTIHNKELRFVGIDKIHCLAQGIIEHLEYLELKKEVE